MGHVFKILALMLLPCVLFAQPVVEWVWEDEDTAAQYDWGIGLDLTQEGGVVFVSSASHRLIRLDANGNFVFRNDTLATSDIASLSDGSFVVPSQYGERLLRIDSTGAVLDTLEEWHEGFYRLQRFGNAVFASYDYAYEVWRDGWPTSVNVAGAYHFDSDGGFVDTQQFYDREYGTGRVVADLCQLTDESVFQADRDPTSSDVSFFRQLFVGDYDPYYYEPDYGCIYFYDAQLAAGPDIRVYQAVLLLEYYFDEGCAPTCPRVDILTSNESTELDSNTTVQFSEDSVTSIVGFENTSDGGSVLVLEVGTWTNFRLKLVKLDVDAAVQWEYEGFGIENFDAVETIIGADDRLTILGKSQAADGSLHYQVVRFAPLEATYAASDPPLQPSLFALHANYPNPFNASTEISFDMPYAASASLRVYDILGREVATLNDGWTEAGTQSVAFDASGLSSGVYIYRLESGEFSQSRKMVLMK